MVLRIQVSYEYAWKQKLLISTYTCTHTNAQVNLTGAVLNFGMHSILQFTVNRDHSYKK